MNSGNYYFESRVRTPSDWWKVETASGSDGLNADRSWRHNSGFPPPAAVTLRGKTSSLHRVICFPFPGALAALALAGSTLGAATSPAPAPTLPARTVAIGRGGADGFVAVDSRGQLHVVFGGKYRAGPAPDQLGPEEAIADGGPVHGVRMATDAAGRPHVVFSNGATSRATQSYYAARIDGRWLPA